MSMPLLDPGAPDASPPLARTPARGLSLADALGIGVNGIVGSGVYLLVAPLAARSGAASVLGVVACGALCVLIALCFAELSSMFDRSGGPYVYARAAFGPVVGFAVGWLGACVGVLGLAAVSNGLAGLVAPLVPGLSGVPHAATLLSLALICGFGAINYRGVKAGGRTSTVLSAVKIVPLVALAVAGLSLVTRASLARIVAPPADGQGLPHAIAGAAFLAIFMTSGFEYATVPAGEVRDPRRTVPLALMGSLLFASLLYAMLQLGALAAFPDLETHAAPLPDLGARLFGAGFGRLVGGAAWISMLGFCSGVALVAPRYFFAMAEDGYLPARLLEVSRFRTPGFAILASTVLTCALAVLLGYASLVDVANVVILSGYAVTALAALVLRLRDPAAPRGVRLPGGIGIPLLALVSAVTLLVSARPKPSEWGFTLQLVLLGLAAWAATWAARRLSAGRG
ncbi:MAG: APC family permease [Myxococcales bacterium]